MSSKSAAAFKRSYFLDHEKGTKFYEVVSIWLEDRKVGVLIKRWGKVENAFRVGGQVKTQYFITADQLERATQEILAEKKKGNKDGKYSASPSRFGLHNIPSGVGLEILAVEMLRHYGSDEGGVICAQLGSSVSGREESVIEEYAAEEIELKPEPARAGDWGSW